MNNQPETTTPTTGVRVRVVFRDTFREGVVVRRGPRSFTVDYGPEFAKLGTRREAFYNRTRRLVGGNPADCPRVE